LDVFGQSDASAGWSRTDNITDRALDDYRSAYGPEVSKDDVFYCVYALLHSRDYREAFTDDLKKMLPRIPMVPTRADFEAFTAAGRRLAQLHIEYEQVDPYPLDITGLPDPGLTGKPLYDWLRVNKMRFASTGRVKDRSTVIYNSRITVTGIPAEAHDYLLGSRSAIEWILERYQVKVDKASGIINDPNDWAREHDQPRYILDLLARVITVSVETVRIVQQLPALAFDQLR
jgi:predicted helicase